MELNYKLIYSSSKALSGQYNYSGFYYHKAESPQQYPEVDATIRYKGVIVDENKNRNIKVELTVDNTGDNTKNMPISIGLDPHFYTGFASLSKENTLKTFTTAGKHTFKFVLPKGETFDIWLGGGNGPMGREPVVSNVYIYVEECLILDKLPISSSLIQAVEQVSNIYNFIEYQNKKLEANLIEKDVEVVPGSKMSTLIDKVKDFKTYKVPKWYEHGDMWIEGQKSPTDLYYQACCVIDDKLHLFMRSNYYIYNTTTNSWKLVSNTMPFDSYSSTCVYRNGIIYHLCSDTTPYTQFYCLDLDTNVCTLLSPCPFGRRMDTHSCVIGDKIHAFANKSYAIYDIPTNTWESQPDLSISVANGYICNIGTDIYLASNNKLFGVLDTLTGIYAAKTSDSLTGTYSLRRVCILSGDLYQVGGNASTQYKPTNRKYDVEGDFWASLQDAPFGIYGGAIGAVGDIFYYSGGQVSTANGETRDKVLVYIPK